MSKRKKTESSHNATGTKLDFVFKKKNYILLLISIAIVIVGFLLMVGREDIYSFTKITIAPFVVVLGFAFGFYAILHDPNKSSN